MSIKFKPLSNYIVLDVRKRKTTRGLVVPDTVKDPTMQVCIVVAISEEQYNGEPMVKNVKIGDNVVFDNAGTFFVNVENKDYLCVRESMIIGILQEEFDEADFESIDLHSKTPLKKPNLKLVN